MGEGERHDDDPEDLLRGLPEESPPPEIVLAAVRLFRYRAFAFIVIAAGLLAGGLLLLHRYLSAGTPIEQQVAAMRRGGLVQPIGQEQTAAGVHVLLWEVVWKDGRGFAHYLAWWGEDSGIDVSLRDLSIAGQPVALTGGEGEASCCPGMAEGWAEFRSPAPPRLPVTAAVDVLSRSETSARPQVLATMRFEVKG
jgi:hypothetical protein